MIWSDLRGDTESQAETSWPSTKFVECHPRDSWIVTDVNGPKVSCASLSKTELYAGNSSYSRPVLAF